MENKLSSNPDYHPIMQADRIIRQFKCPLAWIKLSRVTPCSNFVFSRGGNPAWGVVDPDAGISPCVNRMGKQAYQAHFDGNIYQWEHICWVSIIGRVPSMVIMLHVSDRGPDSGQIPPGHDVPQSNPVISPIHKNTERRLAISEEMHTQVCLINDLCWIWLCYHI